MLQTFLERFVATLGQTSRVANKLFQRGVVAFNSALPKQSRHRKWVIVGVFSFPVLGAVVAVAGSVQNPPPDDNQPSISQAIELNLSEQGVFAVAPLVAEERIRRGDTLVSALNRLGINTEGLTPFMGKDPVASNLVTLRAGRVLSVQQDAKGELVWLRYKSAKESDSQQTILLEKKNGEFSARFEEINYDKQIVFKAGRIESSLFSASDRAGIPDSIAIQLADIFSSEIDFHRELRRGDEFRIVYEDLLIEGRSVSSGRILAAEFVNNNSTHTAYWFAPKNQNAGYYNASGRSLKKSFLRSPLAFSRISSGFTLRRFHPIQQRWKAHTGVDYAAPTGTPIMATSSGVVKFVGQQNGYGNFVEVQHHNGYSTAYAHMSRFVSGLVRGKRVEQGDVIGYVGSTGWATGPHLHYEFRVKSVPKDPQLVAVAEAEPLNRVALMEFKRLQVALDRRLDLAASMRFAQTQAQVQ